MKWSRGARDWQALRRLAAALEGDEASLGRVADDPSLLARSLSLRLGPALALASEELGIEGAAAWRRHLRLAAAAWLMVDQAAGLVEETLRPLGDRWAFIKGYDVGTRFHRQRESRPLSDLDLLVSAETVKAALDLLERRGWKAWSPGPRARRYLEQEGYAWQASGRSSTSIPPILIEVHYRLWGWVASSWPEEIVSSSEAVPSAGPARRPSADQAYLLASVHAWSRPPPRQLTDWWDLARIAERAGPPPGSELAGRIVHRARRWALELPVCLSASVSQRLWPSPVHAAVVRDLEPSLRPLERRILRRLDRHGPDGVALSRVVLARLLAGRETRSGWRSVWRRVWPHPGVVEKETPDGWWWPRRRAAHLLRLVPDEDPGRGNG